MDSEESNERHGGELDRRSVTNAFDPWMMLPYQVHGVPGRQGDDVRARHGERARLLHLGLDILDLLVAAEAVARRGVLLPLLAPRLEHDRRVATLKAKSPRKAASPTAPRRRTDRRSLARVSHFVHATGHEQARTGAPRG